MGSQKLSNRDALIVLSLWSCLMQLSYSVQRRKDRAMKATPTDRSAALLPSNRVRWVDHPIGAWVVENGTVWTITLSKLFLCSWKASSRWQVFMREFIGSLLVDRFGMIGHHIVAHRVYAHLPEFAPQLRSRQKPHCGLLAEFVHLVGVSNIFLAGLTTALASLADGNGQAKGKAKWSLANDLRNFGFLPFCAKLAVARTVVDLLFWLGHYLIHLKATYPVIHKRHHEHTNPDKWTNQHFTVPDLFIEAYFPAGVAFAFTIGTLGPCSKLELNLLTVYIGWLESMSHAGKPIPASTMVAPIAPLYQAFIGDVDRRNVEFHQTHHELLRCNYSITQWPDHLFGTTRFNANPPL